MDNRKTPGPYRHAGRFPLNRSFGKRASKERPERIDSVLGASFDSLGIAARIKEYRIKNAWSRCVGQGIAKRTAPTGLIGKTLYCAVATPAWMTELTYQKGGIIEKINKELNEAAVIDIVFKLGAIPDATVVTSAPPPPPRQITHEEKRFIENSVSVIKDDGLRSVLRRLMEKAI